MAYSTQVRTVPLPAVHLPVRMLIKSNQETMKLGPSLDLNVRLNPLAAERLRPKGGGGTTDF